jgi:prepilin-type N-terminal cleavage/methylation domain-containing protein
MSRSSSLRGFTLIETLVVISLFTLLSLSITGAVTQLYKNNSYALEQANEVDVARRGLTVWMQDAREMTYGANGAYPLALVQPNKIGFYSDIDKDSAVEYIEYVLATSTLYRYTYEATGTPPTYSTSTYARKDTLSQYVQNAGQNVDIFSYYDNQGAVINSPQTNLATIRYITISIIVNIDPSRSPGEFMLKGSSAPRNIKDTVI